MKLSNTGCKNAECLFRWNELFKGHVEPQSTPAWSGRLFHELAHDYISHLIEAIRESDFTFMWEMAEARLVSIEDPWFQKDIKTLVKKFLGMYIHDPRALNFSEHKLAVDWDGNPIPFEEKRGFRGIIDELTVNGIVARVRDWKTGFVVKGYGEAEKDPQMLGYALLVFANFPDVEKISVKLEYIRLGYIEESVVRQEDVKPLWEHILRTRQRIIKADSTKEYPATRCEQCRFCTLDCPIQIAAEAVPKIKNIAEAHKVIENWAVLSQQLKQHEVALENYTTDGNVIVHKGYEVGWAQTFNNTYDWDKVFEVMQEKGMTFLGNQAWKLLTPAKRLNFVEKMEELQVEEIQATGDVKAGKPIFKVRIYRGES